ncbi:MAG: hypothetical protein ACLUEK_10830 [Oscillospiraceae bacterium]
MGVLLALTPFRGGLPPAASTTPLSRVHAFSGLRRAGDCFYTGPAAGAAASTRRAKKASSSPT